MTIWVAIANMDEVLGDIETEVKAIRPTPLNQKMRAFLNLYLGVNNPMPLAAYSVIVGGNEYFGEIELIDCQEGLIWVFTAEVDKSQIALWCISRDMGDEQTAHQYIKDTVSGNWVSKEWRN